MCCCIRDHTLVVSFVSMARHLTWQLRVVAMYSGSPQLIHIQVTIDQARLARFESAGASAHHTLPFSFNPGDAMGMGVCSAEVC